MNSLMIALIATTFAATAAAQTGTVNTATIGDHGTPAMHAAETKKNVEAGQAVTGLTGNKAKQEAVSEVTKAGDHGTPAIHAAEARKNVTASKGKTKPLTSDTAAQQAVTDAVKGQTK